VSVQRIIFEVPKSRAPVKNFLILDKMEADATRKQR
jgi:hypothetical protein